MLVSLSFCRCDQSLLLFKFKIITIKTIYIQFLPITFCIATYSTTMHGCNMVEPSMYNHQVCKYLSMLEHSVTGQC